MKIFKMLKTKCPLKNDEASKKKIKIDMNRINGMFIYLIDYFIIYLIIILKNYFSFYVSRKMFT
jgi:hypothetical protein